MSSTKATPATKQFDLGSLRALRVLGHGSNGTVFLVAGLSSSDPGSLHALKVFHKHNPSAKPDADRRARWELAVLSLLGSGAGAGDRARKHLPALLGHVETPDIIAWAVPFCAGGDLNVLRHRLPDRVFSAAAIRFYVAEVVTALAHLHGLGIVYRDLKPENILLNEDGHVVLTDFDLSKRLTPRSPSSLSSSSSSLSSCDSSPTKRQQDHRRRSKLSRFFSFGSTGSEGDKRNALSSSSSQSAASTCARVSPAARSFSSCSSAELGKSFSFVGTEEYVSPEVVRGEGHDFAVDWWALGILTYEMAFGRTPFRGRNKKETFRNVVTRPPEFSGRQPPELVDFVRKLLEKDPARRLGFAGGADEVRSHPFFSGVQWDILGDVTRPPFIADGDVSPPAENEGFDIRDYFRQPPAPEMTAPLTGF